jgi:hypothetical protein
MAVDDDCVDHEDFQNLSARLDYLHSEAKSFRSEVTGTMHAIDKRVSHLEYEDNRKDERLGNGAATMVKLGDQIERVNAKIDTPWYRVVAMVFPVLLLIGSWVWFAARMPSGDEFENLKRQVWTLQSQQEQTNAKLDVLLRRP